MRKQKFYTMDYKSLIKSENVVLVEFYASWCPHCQRMAPVVEGLKDLVNGKIGIHQIDVDEHEQLAEENGADTIPTFILYKDGQEVWRHTGEIESDALLSLITAAAGNMD